MDTIKNYVLYNKEPENISFSVSRGYNNFTKRSIGRSLSDGTSESIDELIDNRGTFEYVFKTKWAEYPIKLHNEILNITTNKTIEIDSYLNKEIKILGLEFDFDSNLQACGYRKEMIGTIVKKEVKSYDFIELYGVEESKEYIIEIKYMPPLVNDSVVKVNSCEDLNLILKKIHKKLILDNSFFIYELKGYTTEEYLEKIQEFKF